ncbi:helix-turn-helix domain-containing protein [Clostridium sp. YIM B02551]|uniref:helix-turn-helix domain-containing protein n=1 Tax=Clostridium sp. YIM B02551 TaxID=2910679 RepID=UPI001EEB4435|nr:helix-turn-helix domain-containing protein [Clostridium sp. YIM B02551]
MGRKSNILPEVKIKIIEDYLEGQISVIEAATKLGVSVSGIKGWIRKYRSFGPEGLIPNTKNTYYNSSLKLLAITDYMMGNGSLNDICKQYRIRTIGILHRWIKQYNNGHKVSKSHNNKGDRIMTNGRKTTYEERVEIVSFCIANANDYSLAANKYDVSYQQVYTWVNKYNKNGYDALVDRRGKHKQLEDLSESDRISVQLKLLEAENKRLKMENDFLKKLQEIERR